MLECHQRQYKFEFHFALIQEPRIAADKSEPPRPRVVVLFKRFEAINPCVITNFVFFC